MDTSNSPTAIAVATSTARNHAISADHDFVDLRVNERLAAGSYVHEGPALTTGWHSHDLHQLEYSLRGALGLETHAGRYVVLPQQVAWIPAGVSHISTLGAARTVSVFLAPDLVQGTPTRATAFRAAPLLREMMLHATEWPITRHESGPVADAFFAALALLLPGWLEDRQPALPVSTDPLVNKAIHYTHAHLQTVTHTQLSRALGTSERTLRRRFVSETGTTWRSYLQLARLLRAMGALASSNASIIRVAVDAGFDNPVAFTRAFVQQTGETPTAYRRRILAAD